MNRRKFGEILILGSVCLGLFIYLPFLTAYLPNTKFVVPSSGSYISIPKIHARAPIIDNVDPWNQEEYEMALKKGVASSEINPNFLFAHSSLDPWEMTRVNTAFLRLSELINGDQINVYHDGQIAKYYVYDKVEVWPHEVSILNQPPDVLILQTCTPIGTSLKRLLVFAK